MPQNDFTMTLLVDAAPQEVYNAINDVRGWWSENIEGDTDRLNADYHYHYKDVHLCTIRVTALEPGKRVVWQVLDNHFSFTCDAQEWIGDELIFEMAAHGAQTGLTFTQRGLTRADECFDVCQDAWTGFIGNSLRKRIETGKGEPTPREQDGDFNEALIQKWRLKERARPAGFTFTFKAAQPPAQVFEQLLDARSWWTGLFDEQIEGSSHALNEAFTFKAGNGAHYSRQQLITREPNEQITWLVTDSHLSFLQQPAEWTGSTIGFALSGHEGHTNVTFRHEGLVPAIECYDSCTNAWTQYLQRLSKKLQPAG